MIIMHGTRIGKRNKEPRKRLERGPRWGQNRKQIPTRKPVRDRDQKITRETKRERERESQRETTRSSSFCGG